VPFKEKILKSLKFYFLSGVLVIVPLIITYVVLKFLFVGVDNLLSPLIVKLTGYYIPGLGILATLILIFLAGFFTTNIVGLRVFSLWEKIFVKTPLVRTIYIAAKQLVEGLAISDKKAFQKVVLVEYPRSGIYALGFITKEVEMQLEKKEPGKLLAVYIPSTPTPFTGIVILFPKEEVIFLDLSVEEGVKFVVSGGIASPEKLSILPKITASKTEDERKEKV
jgi:uncharacterized membrane protein